MMAVGNKLTREATREGAGNQDWFVQSLAQILQPCCLVGGSADNGEREAVRHTNIAVDDVAHVLSQSEPLLRFGLALHMGDVTNIAVDDVAHVQSQSEAK